VSVQEVAALSETLTLVRGEGWRSVSRKTVAVYVWVCAVCVVRDSQQGDWCYGADAVRGIRCADSPGEEEEQPCRHLYQGKYVSRFALRYALNVAAGGN
jgi:hypothetical protein